MPYILESKHCPNQLKLDWMCIDCPDLLILLNEFAHASIQTALYIFYSIIISQLRVRNISGIKNLYPKNLYTPDVKSV